MSKIKIKEINDITDGIKNALDQKETINVIGCGTKSEIGQIFKASNDLDISSYSGINLYEPEELVIGLKTGTKIKDIQKLLNDHDQEFAFEPPDYGPILGHKPNRGTIGGSVAMNVAGSRRISKGAMRDHLLGINGVSGRGEAFKTGGRVVKNVSGYDVCKIMAGSWGTLAILSDVTIKVLPKAETSASVILLGLSLDEALKVMAKAASMPLEVSGCAYIPEQLVRSVDDAIEKSAVLVRIEGVKPSVDYKLKMLIEAFDSFTETKIIKDKKSRQIWKKITDVMPFSFDVTKPLWKIHVQPSKAVDVIDNIKPQIDVNYFCDWAGNLVWLQIEDELDDAGARVVRQAIKIVNGHAMLFRASADIRSRIPVFQPLSPVHFGLNERLRQAFDPMNILNPGRMILGESSS